MHPKYKIKLYDSKRKDYELFIGFNFTIDGLNTFLTGLLSNTLIKTLKEMFIELNQCWTE